MGPVVLGVARVSRALVIVMSAAKAGPVMSAPQSERQHRRAAEGLRLLGFILGLISGTRSTAR